MEIYEITGEFPSQRATKLGLYFVDVSPNKLFNKHRGGRRCETPWDVTAMYLREKHMRVQL